MHRNKLYSSLATATVLLIAAGSANAADLYGGGATFPAPAYVGDLYNSASPKFRLSRDASIASPAVTSAALGNTNPGPSATLTPVFAKFRALYPADAASYCQTGSGTGKKVLNNDGLAANGACGDASTPAPTGFASNGPSPDFIGTDSPISTADYTTFNTNVAATRTAIVQIPTLAGAIALPFEDTNVTALALNTEKVCRIYSAQITDWTDPLLGLGLSGSHPITIVYRQDGSGTSFAFTSYLAAQCNGRYGVPGSTTNPNDPTNFFKPNQSFETAVKQSGVWPAYAALAPASGNSGVVAKVNSTVDAFGYGDVAEVIAQGVMYATVNTFSPSAMPASLSLAPSSLLQGQVLNGATTAAAPGSATAAQKNCLKLVSPSAPISGAYPIVAVTYLNAYYGANAAAKVTPLRNLFKLFYDTTNAPTLPTGYSYLSGNALFRSQINSAIASCIN